MSATSVAVGISGRRGGDMKPLGLFAAIVGVGLLPAVGVGHVMAIEHKDYTPVVTPTPMGTPRQDFGSCTTCNVTPVPTKSTKSTKARVESVTIPTRRVKQAPKSSKQNTTRAREGVQDEPTTSAPEPTAEETATPVREPNPEEESPRPIEPPTPKPCIAPCEAGDAEPGPTAGNSEMKVAP